MCVEREREREREREGGGGVIRATESMVSPPVRIT